MYSSSALLIPERDYTQGEQLNILRVDPRADPLWQTLVEQAPSSVFHSPSWIQVLKDTYGWDAHAYVLLDNQGKPRAGIPFCRIADMMGERIVALPFSDYCDPLVDHASQWQSLINRLLPEQCPIAVRCLHNGLPLEDERFTLAKHAKWHRLDLRPDLDALWRGMDDSTHRAIRKSQREGLAVRVAQSEQELRTFFEMHLKVRKYKYGLLAQPYSFFQNIWCRFVQMQRGFLLLAVYDDKIVAGDFFLEWKDTLYYKFNASLPGDLSHRPNDLLIWEAIQYGKNRGLTYLDFGLSDMDQEGLVRYKRKFATEEKIISFLRHVPNSSPSPAEKEMRDLLTKLANSFTDKLVPDQVTERAGEDLYRYFT
jgi:CelD/BcsL family acetyltransferase involved in cellulose biosynthesis